MSIERQFRDLRDLLENSEKLYSEDVAFKMKYKGSIVEIKYGQFANDVKCLGSYLINLNTKNKRVAIISNNRYEWCVSYFATATSDLTVVPLDKSLPEDEFHSLIERSEADVIIYENKYEDFIKNELDKPTTSVKHVINMDTDFLGCIDQGKVIYNRKNSPYKKVKVENDKMRFMLFTSGTTSASKCVMLSHKNLCTNINQIDKKLDISKSDSVMSFLPIHHTFECTADFLYVMSKGGSFSFCEGIRHIMPNIKEFEPTIMIGVPTLFETMYKRIWKTIHDGKREKQVKVALKASEALLKVGVDLRKQLFKQIHENFGNRFKYFVSGAAGINPDILKGFEEFGIIIYQGYGLTETSPVIAVEYENDRRIGSVGKVVDKLEIRIDDKNEDGIGEIVVKSNTVMLGYYQNEEATKAVLSKGWFKTGDLGRIDKDGFLFITGRKKDVIVLSNGKNVFPEEIESIINNEVEYVKESMVFGEEEDNDVILKVKIVYDKESIMENLGIVTDEELNKIFWDRIKEINKKLPTYKYIKGMILTDEELIKTTTQKIKRFEEMKKINSK